MLLPIRIVHPYQRVPYVTNALLGLNVAAFLFTVLGRPDAWLRGALDTENLQPHQLVTHMFLHVGLIHLMGNMLFLAVYGRYVEERLGPALYAAAYLLFGLVAAVFYLVFDDGRAVGASGAIAGLMGFVLVGAPWAEVRVLFILYVRFQTFEVAAFWLLGAWILFQVLHAAAAGGFSNIAYSAHFGGFLAGCALAAFLRSPKCEGTDWYLDPAPPGGGIAAMKRLAKTRGAGGSPPRALCGAAPEHVVVLESIEGAPSEVAVIKLLMSRCAMEPDAAKQRIDLLRRGMAQRFGFPEASAAAAFAEEARSRGVRATFREPAPPLAPTSPLPPEPIDLP